METKNSKTEKMKTTTIFHNADKTALDVANVHKVKAYLEFAAESIISLNADPKHALNVIQNNYSDIKNDYISVESQKLEAAAVLLGASALIDVAREKIYIDAEKLVTDLRAKIKPIEWQMNVFTEYFEFADGLWTIRKGFEKEIEKVNSIILTDAAEIERYNKHIKLVELLNELKGEGANLQNVITRMVKFDFTTGLFSMNYRPFDKNNVLPAYC